MKKVILLPFLCCLSLCVGSWDQRQEGWDVGNCLSPTGFKFTLSSRRNQTGHWIAQVNFEHGTEKDTKIPWDLDIDHTTTKCDGQESVLIVATVTAPPGFKGAGLIPSKGKEPQPTPTSTPEATSTITPKPTSTTTPKPTSTTTPKPRRQVPTGYTYLSGSGYIKPYAERKKWFDAREHCEREGAHLAVVNSAAEAKFISSLWNSPSPWAYIGTHDLYAEGHFVTVFNQTLPEAGYDIWAPGEPNGGTNENCGVIFKNSKLGNYFCPLPLPFICEFTE